MKAKVFMANVREFRIATREHRDDGQPRRLAREPLTADEVRAISRERKPRISSGERIRLELSRRAYMTPQARAARAALMGVR